ncbi:uncharacterized protein At1g66480-like [Rutidosis leptorrhynchoides]|uniref:uncharacterized protein At1g66480-like n=1 Tax=Rutidosis leptorrhynchoides TaxID=125765 RepID=UPI003A99A7C6
MGNSLAGKTRSKKAKIMKIDGEIFKLNTPIKVFEVIKDYPSHVLLDSKSVKQYGIRAEPLHSQDYLEGGKVYFLVELPKLPDTTDKKVVNTRRVKSGVNITNKERLELLMMARRSVSEDMEKIGEGLDGCGSVRVKVRLPKMEVDKLIDESRDEVEVVERIVDLYVKKKVAA